MAMIKAHTEYLTFHTEERYEMVHITSQVEEIVRRSGIEDGLCFVSPMHITAAIYVNDNEEGLIEDIGTWLEKLAPAWPGYKHHRTVRRAAIEARYCEAAGCRKRMMSTRRFCVRPSSVALLATG